MLSVSVASGYGTVDRHPVENATTTDSAESKTMKQTLATLSLGSASRRDIHPLLLEHLPADQIYHVALLEGLSAEAVERLYGPAEGEDVVMFRTEEGTDVALSAARVEEALQQQILVLEAQGCETILLLGGEAFKNLRTKTATLLEPHRLLPPLVNAIIEGHQVGIVIAREENLSGQARKWKNLAHPPHFAVASPWQSSDDELVDAALALQEKGADVVVLDCLGYHQRHRDFLQKLLGIPVLLSNMLIAKLAAELLV